MLFCKDTLVTSAGANFKNESGGTAQMQLLDRQPKRAPKMRIKFKNAEFAWLSKNVFTEEARSEDLQHPSSEILVLSLLQAKPFCLNCFIYAM